MPLLLTFSPNGAFKGAVKKLFTFKGTLKDGKGETETRFLLSHLPGIGGSMPPVITSKAVQKGSTLTFLPQGEAASKGPLECSATNKKAFQAKEKEMLGTLKMLLGMADKSVIAACKSHLSRLVEANAIYRKGHQTNAPDKKSLLQQAGLTPEELNELTLTCGGWTLGPVKEKKNKLGITGFPPLSSLKKKCRLSAMVDMDSGLEILTSSACP